MRIGDFRGSDAGTADLCEQLGLHVVGDRLAVIGRQVRVRIGGRDRRCRLAAGHGQRQHGAGRQAFSWVPPRGVYKSVMVPSLDIEIRLVIPPALAPVRLGGKEDQPPYGAGPEP